MIITPLSSNLTNGVPSKARRDELKKQRFENRKEKRQRAYAKKKEKLRAAAAARRLEGPRGPKDPSQMTEEEKKKRAGKKERRRAKKEGKRAEAAAAANRHENMNGNDEVKEEADVRVKKES